MISEVRGAVDEGGLVEVLDALPGGAAHLAPDDRWLIQHVPQAHCESRTPEAGSLDSSSKLAVRPIGVTVNQHNVRLGPVHYGHQGALTLAERVTEIAGGRVVLAVQP